MSNGLSFDQLMNLLKTDFFSISQVKEIRSALLKDESPKMHLSDDQIKQFVRLSQGFEQ
jgi:hypothetical protein